MRSAVESVAYWGNDEISGMNDSLRVFKRLAELYVTHRPKLYIASSNDYLVARLASMDTRGIDVGLFESCKEAGRLWSENLRLNYEWNRASLDLHHPHGSRPDLALAFLLNVDACYEPFFNTGDDFLDTSINMKIMETAYALHYAGRTTEARQVLDIGRRRQPSYFQGKPRIPQQRNHKAVSDMFSQRRVERQSDRAKLLASEYERNSMQELSNRRAALNEAKKLKSTPDWSRG